MEQSPESENRIARLVSRIHGILAKGLCFLVPYVLAILVAVIWAEVWARWDVSMMELPVYQPRYVPYLENVYLHTYGEEQSDTEPERSDYTKARRLYRYVGETEIHYPGERYEDVFQHKRDEAKRRDCCRVFFVGGSTAWGLHVGNEYKYFSILEKLIRHGLPSLPYIVKTVPAAIVAINSTQENILFNLTVLPNKPDYVVFLDGWNDFDQVYQYAVRPGDPLTISTLYNTQYDPLFDLKVWLAKRSYLYRKIFVKGYNQDKKEHIQKILNDSEFRGRLLKSSVNVYLSNIDTMMRSCEARGIEAYVAFQPFRGWVRKQQGKSLTEKEVFICDAYERVLERVGEFPWGKERTIDVLDTVDLHQYIDVVHFNQDGQAKLAAAFLEHFNNRLPPEPQTGWRAPAPFERPDAARLLPPLSTWIPSPGVAVLKRDNYLVVRGESEENEIRIESPTVVVPPNTRVTLRMRIVPKEGHIGLGVIGEDDSEILLKPGSSYVAGQKEMLFSFNSGDNSQVRLVVSDIENRKLHTQPVEFLLFSGTYRVE